MSIFARDPAGASVASNSFDSAGKKSSSCPHSRIASNTFLVITNSSIQKPAFFFCPKSISEGVIKTFYYPRKEPLVNSLARKTAEFFPLAGQKGLRMAGYFTLLEESSSESSTVSGCRDSYSSNSMDGQTSSIPHCGQTMRIKSLLLSFSPWAWHV
jgi:hypothetical protein